MVRHDKRKLLAGERFLKAAALAWTRARTTPLAGNLSVLHGIPPIGSKFLTAEQQSWTGRPNLSTRRGEYTATLHLFSGRPPASAAAR